MAEGDKILIDTLRVLGGSEDDRVEKLSDFTPNYILESVSKCINTILVDHGDEPAFDSTVAPASMSARYNMGMKCAEMCTSLGYPDKNIGYQTFLYSNEKDLRNILMFLVDKLPKVEEIHDQEEDYKSATKNRIAGVIASQMGQDWMPRVLQPKDTQECDEFCACEVCIKLDWSDDTIIKLLPKETKGSFFTKSSYASKSLCSALETNDELDTLTNYRPELNLETFANIPETPKSDNINVQHDEFETVISSSDDPILGLNGLHGKKDINNDPSINDVAKDNEDADKALEVERQLQSLREAKVSVEREIEELKADYVKMRNKGMEARNAIKEGEVLIVELEEKLAKEEEAAKKREKLLTLLPDCEENLVKMEAIVKKNKAKLEALHSQWESFVEEKDREHEELAKSLAAKQEMANKSVSSSEVLRLSIEEVDRQLKQKSLMEQKYSKEVAKLCTDHAPRSSYTKQIHDILKNVARQRNETSKIIADIRVTQNDINLLEGKMLRTYVDVDRAIYHLASKDQQSIPAYKEIVKIHQKTEKIIDTIRAVGQTKRATRTAEDQEAAEKSKNHAANIKRLEADLKLVKEENSQLRQKIKKQTK